jgi:NAD(P)-dependent dehydrogenase (short-subunit alcohol dehydrogenase family)
LTTETVTGASDLDDDVFSPSAIRDPYTYYGRIRETDPVRWNETAPRLGRDGVVTRFKSNNVGIAVIKPYLDHSDADVDRQVDVHPRRTYYFMCAVIPGIVQRQAGAVVNIASAAALHYTAPNVGHGPSKAAIIALSRDVAFEVARPASK